MVLLLSRYVVARVKTDGTLRAQGRPPVAMPAVLRSWLRQDALRASASSHAWSSPHFAAMSGALAPASASLPD